jgi:hypothetical protein
MANIPVLQTWPYQTGLTYPFDTTFNDGGICAPMDPRIFKISQDHICLLDSTKNYSKITRFTK